VPKIPLQKAGFQNKHPARQARRDERRRSNPHHPKTNPVNAFTMGGIVRDAGLTEDEFRDLLK
jgi:hypothetical protein